MTLKNTKYYIDYTETNKILPIIGLSLHQITEESGIQKKKFQINIESDLEVITTIASMVVCSLTEAEYVFNEKCMIENSSNQEDAVLVISNGDSSGIVTAPIIILSNMFIRVKSYNTLKHIDEVFSNLKSIQEEDDSFEQLEFDSPETDVLLNIAQSSNEETEFPDNIGEASNQINSDGRYTIDHLGDQIIPIDTINLNDLKTLKKESVISLCLNSESIITGNLIENKQNEELEQSNINLKEVNNKLMIENHMLNKSVLEYENKIAQLTVQVSS